MNTTKSPQSHSSFSVLQVLAQLLHKLDRSAAGVDATQYRAVARRLAEELESAEPGPALEAVLDAFPSAAEIYENIRYRHAGLCRSPLEAALPAELRAREAIERAHQRPLQGLSDAQS